MGSWKIWTIGVVGLALTACGGTATKEKAASGSTTTKEKAAVATRGIDPPSVQSCLTKAGLEVVASGNLPVIQRSKAMEVRLPSGGKVMPGNLSAAIFWYGSGSDATRARESDSPKFAAVTQVDQIVAVFDPMPSADLQTKVTTCITRG